LPEAQQHRSDADQAEHASDGTGRRRQPMSDSMTGEFRVLNQERQARLQGMPLASFGSRAGAFLIDGVILGLLLLVPNLWSSLETQATTAPLTLTLDFGALVSVVIGVLYFGLGTFLGNGATPGKRALGIRVVSLVHERISLWHSIERALGYAASSLEAGFGFLQYFTHPNRQTVHDRIAETIVISDARAAAPAPPAPG
jgi:uncharacterized RDD family membrane protein YckC